MRQFEKRYGKIALGGAGLFVLAALLWWQIGQAGAVREELWGMADAKETAIHSKVSGRILRLAVEEGAQVEKGALLAVIDRDSQSAQRMSVEGTLRAQAAQIQQAAIQSRMERETLNAALRTAEAQAEEARIAFELAQREEARYRALLADGAVSRQQYDVTNAAMERAEAAYASARAGLASAESSLAKNEANRETEIMQQQTLESIKGQLAAVQVSENEAEIRAPYAGTVTKKYLEEGALVSPTVPLFSIQDTNDNWVIFKVKETELGGYHIGDEVTLCGRNESLTVKGRVESISRKAEYATIKATNERGDKDIVTFDVKIRTDSPNVWPGMRFRLAE